MSNKSTVDNTFDYNSIKSHRQKLKATQDDLAKWLNLDRTTIIRYEHGKAKPSEEEIINRLKEFFKLQSKEEMFPNFTDDFGVHCETQFQEGKKVGYKLIIPYIISSFYNKFAKSLDYGKITTNLFKNEVDTGFYVAFDVSEDAVGNGDRGACLCKGDIAIAKEIAMDNFEELINPTEIWIVIFDDTIYFRKIAKYFVEEKEVLFQALNPSKVYPDLHINISEIKKIYKVVQKVTNSLN